jgi:Cu+-exporting ATPase
MTVTEAKARAANRSVEYQGKTYFFCCDGCKQKFQANPAKFLANDKPK